jgi:hypothetical protein
MMRRWRVALILSAVICIGRLAAVAPLVDVVSGAVPDDVRLTYPVGHVLLAPLTLLADWLNGGSRHDLIGFGAWSLVTFVLLRLAAPAGGRRWLRETAWAAAFAAALAAFVGWGALVPRPIPRLVAADSAIIIFDAHTHTTRSHDGRKGFGVDANAAWHERAGFDAAFVTDHNAVGAAAEWRARHAGRAPRLLAGEELSLWGLHILVLGNDTLIPNRPWSQSFDSSLILLRRITGGDAPDSLPASRSPLPAVYLVASLPEYWRHHWGERLGQVLDAGVEGLEVWTTSPKAMEFPVTARGTVLAQARARRLGVFGATDMHGLGHAATVWNVGRIPGWQALDDAALSAVLIAGFRARGPAAHRVVALRRWLPEDRLGQAVSVPANVLLLLRTASPRHTAALLVWTWGLALLVTRRRRPPTP